MVKNWKTKAVTAVLALAVLAPTAAFAADAITGKADALTKKGIVHHRFLNEEHRQEMQAQILDNVGKYTPENLEEWKNALAEQEQLMNDLKAKLPADRQRPELSEETKEKVKAIHEEVRNGALTPEQAGEQLKELGIEKFRGFGGPQDRPQLSEETKEKIKAIHEEVRNGTLTPEQAGEQLKELGLDGKKVKVFVKNSLMAQYKEAVDAGDEAKIKELLPQMLEQLKEKNQALSERLAESGQ
ncbi:MAG: hypothetical protein AB1815_12830 [Bacillota bacterium]|jgi:hypothetical protein